MFSTQGTLRWLIAFHCIFASVCPTSSALASDPPAFAWMCVAAASDDALSSAPEVHLSVTERGLPLAILKDQIPVWTSPVRIRTHDLKWLLPLGTAMGVTLATDSDVMRNVSPDPAFNKDNVNASNI